MRLYQLYVNEHGAAKAQARFNSGWSNDPRSDRFGIVTRDLSRELIKEWGIFAFVDPAQRRPRGLRFAIDRVGAISPVEEEGTVKVDLKKGQVVVMFDLNLSLERQIDEARFTLDLVREEFGIPRPVRPRRPRAKWRLYLRVLDAKAAGATYESIAATLFPSLGPELDPIKKVDDTLRQARATTKPAVYLRIV
jgi:hypothetical protein